MPLQPRHENTCTHAHMHTCTHAHTRTHTHTQNAMALTTHTLPPPLPCFLPVTAIGLQSRRFPEARGRFYAAEIVCALLFLHKRNIVYR